MVTLHMNVDRCKSCGYCILACPSKALKLSGSLNKEGYDVVENDESKCTNAVSATRFAPTMYLSFTNKRKGVSER